MKLIVGLGNPGKEYQKTRHNIGFMVVDQLASELDIAWKIDEKKKGAIISTTLNNEKIILLKPLTYMNLSGEAVYLVKEWYKIKLENILIIYDDLSLPVGKIRLRAKGSSGGHNGVKSIIHHLQTEEIKRLKIGIDHPGNGKDVANYVLSPFVASDSERIKDTIEEAVQAIKQWVVKDNFLQVMNEFNI